MSGTPADEHSRARRRGETHRRLATAAIAEFERVGLARSSVERTCRAAGVTRPTFYAHFPTREAVLLELQGSAADAIGRAILSRLARAARIGEVLDALVDGLFAAAASIPPRLRSEIVSFDVRGRSPERWVGTPLFEALRERFDAALRRGEIDPEHDAASLVRRVLVTVLGFVAGDAPDLAPSREDARAVLRAFGRGLDPSAAPCAR